jgi:hypothetical protein
VRVDADGSVKTTEFQGPETSSHAAVLLVSRNSHKAVSSRHRATRSRSSLMAANKAESISDLSGLVSVIVDVVVDIPFLSENVMAVTAEDGILLDGIVLVETEIDVPPLAPGADDSTMRMIPYF